jgi:hypothetical protein
VINEEQMGNMLASVQRAAAEGASLDAALAAEVELQPRLFGSADCLEGLTAFVERRPARFGASASDRR